MMTSFLDGVLRKFISFHSVDINRRKMFLIKFMHYCIAQKYVNMQGDIFYCTAHRYAKRYKHMQGDIFYCIAYRYAKRY